MRAKHDNSVYEAAQKLLRYEPETGLFYWLVQRGGIARVGDVAGAVTPTGYVIIRVNKKTVLAHRLAWYIVHNELPDEIDHINHNRQDNRLGNLRSADRKTNGRNLVMKSNNTSGVSNIVFDKRGGKWVLQAMVDGRMNHIGSSRVFDDLAAVRDSAMENLGFHERHGVGRRPEPTPLRAPELRGVSFCKREGKYHVRKRINRKERSFGYFKTREEAEARLQLITEFAQAFR